MSRLKQLARTPHQVAWEINQFLSEYPRATEGIGHVVFADFNYSRAAIWSCFEPSHIVTWVEHKLNSDHVSKGDAILCAIELGATVEFLRELMELPDDFLEKVAEILEP